MAVKIDGKMVSAQIKANLAERVAALKEQGVNPGLGTILVGSDAGSVKYVAGKHADCAEIGVNSIKKELPADATFEQIAEVVQELNADPACTGYIVQLPLPKGIDENAIIDLIDPKKDADGMHPYNLGELVLHARGEITTPLPCTPLIFFGISITLLYVATSKKKYVFTALGLAAVGSVAGYSMFGHVRERVMIWLDPWKYKLGESYQIIEGMYSIAAGGLFGVGLGQGHFQNLPVKESDMIYAIICEEFGIIFAIGLMIIYFLLFYRGIRAAFVTNDKYSQLIAVGFSTMIACQTLVIIGGIFAVIPLTGITLPIISYGGSSVLTIFFALGILQKISEEA